MTSPRRLRWLLPALLVLGWLVLAGVTGPYSGRLSEVQQNDSSQFLPAAAESQRVSELSRGFTTTQAFPAFVVLESPEALTDQQLARFRSFAEGIGDLPVPVTGAADRTVGEFLVPGPIPVVPSPDGRAALALVSFDIDQLGSTLPDGESPIKVAVDQIRAREGSLDEGGAGVA